MKRRKSIKIAALLIALIVFAVAIAAYRTYNAKVDAAQTTDIYIYPFTTYTELRNDLHQKGIVNDIRLFDFYAKASGYNKRLKAGHYVVKPKMKIWKLINDLRHGNQQPVKLVIGKSRLSEDFANKVSSGLMFKPQELIAEMQKEGIVDSIFFFVVPNTYEVYWTISPADFISRMKRESSKFWQSKSKQLENFALNRYQIISLASIIEEETNKNDEKPIMAGVYINRLNKDMLLQADPTVKYALKNFMLKRIKGEHLKVSSPYNTYINKGLPPTPICLPSLASINAVLNYVKHDYLFFCAKEDFSGYHNFATNANQHELNRRLYIRELNKRGIK
ncbi:MAG: endolytic transglycosylase MltG [Bacteroidales bacterium]|jgi:UPF0755 protein|nr:endolytic transglycosylase MltG [Bacteroidales bacterium]